MTGMLRDGAQATADADGALLTLERIEDLSELLELAPDAMVVADATGEIVALNEQAVTLFGYTREQLRGQRVEVLVPERMQGRHVGHRSEYGADPHRRAMGEGLELRGRRRDGSEFPVEISLSPLMVDDGLVVVSAIRDATARLRAERAASHFVAVVESSHDAIIGKDLDGTIVSWNRGAERLYGYSAADVIGRSISILLPPGHEDELPDVLKQVRLGQRVDDYETVRIRRDGTQVDVSLTVSPILDADGNVIGASTIARDISARLRYLADLRFMAEHDALTGVRNRRHFERDVADQVERAHRYGEQAALLLIDVDRFKAINDLCGHRTGDRALQNIARAISGRVRRTDTVARIGGDEFAVLLPYAGRQQAEVVAAALAQTVADLAPLTHDGASVRLTVSVGIAVIDDATVSDEAVMLEADRAMYAEKDRRG